MTLEPNWQAAFERTLVHLLDIDRERLESAAERDRLRAALGGITIAMKQRAISARAVGNVYAEGAALDVLALLESHGFGGER